MYVSAVGWPVENPDLPTIELSLPVAASGHGAADAVLPLHQAANARVGIVKTA